MKKTLLALAVAAVATSASAATVYNNDGTQVDVGGRFDVALGKFNDNERADLRNVGSRLEFKAQHDLGEGVKVIGYSRLRFNDGGDKWDTGSSFNNIKTNKLWLALQKDEIGRVSFGKQDTTGDAVELNDHSYLFGGNNNLFTGGDKVVSFRSADFQLAEGQTLGFGADYTFGQAKKQNEASDLKYAYGTSAFYAGQFADVGVNLNAGYTVEVYDNGEAANKDATPPVQAKKTTGTGRKVQSWRVASQFTYGPATFGAEYGQSYYKDHQTQDQEGRGRFLEVAAKYQYLENASVYAAWERNQYKGNKAGLSFDKGDANFLRSVVGTLDVAKNQKLTENVYLVGADYAFNKNVVAYVEYAHSRVKGTGTIGGNDVKVKGQTQSAKDNRYAVGLRVYF
ncbi:porin [Avibacterium sp. 20-15]|uniref:porin n=1 Tax=unclassified Avibacterium TaxID=2685287 RepID=UPI002026C425|nr:MULTISPECIES: porin [unclassified Avibacterium]MCW9733520.1 porin [Avibacterium sp. 20-15]URL03380.1 porin [Avibacterium sp. 20-132]URL06146.1 porin [Avibacterium sp. 21-595]